MKLTPEQIETVRQWAAAGDTLNDIQRKLKSELEVNCTYMDLRLGMIDLDIKLVEKPKAAPALASPAPVAAPLDTPLSAEGGDAAPASQVQVTLDELTLPGTMASGKASFSDGKILSWYVDESGRLGMKAPDPSYQPPQQDIPEFQAQLDRLLMQAGF
jgi:hypothetical protein